MNVKLRGGCPRSACSSGGAAAPRGNRKAAARSVGLARGLGCGDRVVRTGFRTGECVTAVVRWGWGLEGDGRACRGARFGQRIPARVGAAAALPRLGGHPGSWKPPRMCLDRRRAVRTRSRSARSALGSGASARGSRRELALTCGRLEAAVAGGSAVGRSRRRRAQDHVRTSCRRITTGTYPRALASPRIGRGPVCAWPRGLRLLRSCLQA